MSDEMSDEMICEMSCEMSCESCNQNGLYCNCLFCEKFNMWESLEDKND